MDRSNAIKGVYAIRCKATGSSYIGSSINIHSRWLDHRSLLRRGRHTNPRLQRVWNEHGEANLEFILLECVPSKRDLVAAEQKWLDAMQDKINVVPFADKRAAIAFQGPASIGRRRKTL